MLSLVQVMKGIDKLRKVIDRELFQEQHSSFLVMLSGIGAKQAVLPMIRLIFKVEMSLLKPSRIGLPAPASGS
jgi:hypothetical protein